MVQQPNMSEVTIDEDIVTEADSRNVTIDTVLSDRGIDEGSYWESVANNNPDDGSWEGR